MVYYRKYRPQTIEDLDKEDIRIRLKSLLSKPEIPHAFLFTGSKGIGKTSTARIIAKVVNCTGKNKPCNKCENCMAITKGSHVDVIEIDAASNRGIDEIRDLREKISFLPAMGKKKVYIIDEVHMLTKEAFNALLKTLEEPPSHALFILATTEVHKLPDTILSRCTIFTFTKATPDELKRSLDRVVVGEKLRIDEKTLNAIARRSDGSFRDATKLLEQLVSESEKKDISFSSTSENNFIAGSETDAKIFITLLVGKKTVEAIEFLEKREKSGADFQEFTKTILMIFHEHMLARYGQESEMMKELSVLSIHELKYLIKLFASAYQEMKGSVIVQLPLELAVIEWCDKK